MLDGGSDWDCGYEYDPIDGDYVGGAILVFKIAPEEALRTVRLQRASLFRSSMPVRRPVPLAKRSQVRRRVRTKRASAKARSPGRNTGGDEPLPHSHRVSRSREALA